MIRTTLQILLISVIIIYGNTISGFGQNIQDYIWKKFLFPKYPKTLIDRPFFCNLCLTFWCGVIVLLYKHQFTLPMIGIVALISYLTDVTETLLRFIKDLLIKITDLLYKII